MLNLYSPSYLFPDFLVALNVIKESGELIWCYLHQSDDVFPSLIWQPGVRLLTLALLQSNVTLQ